MRKLLKGSVLFSGMLLSNASLHAVYKASNVSSMPRDTVNFINNLNRSVQQASYLTALPNSQLGIRRFENYYKNNHNNFNEILINNIEVLERAQKALSETARMGKPYDVVSTCLRNDKDWRRFNDSFKSLGVLKDYAETSVMTRYPGTEADTLDSTVKSDFSDIAAALDTNRLDGSFWTPIDDCCEAAMVSRVGNNFCNRDYALKKLSMLSEIKKVPSTFVDPLNPGPYAPTLSSQDIVELMSLGQMQDFVDAKDFNSQADALMRTDMRCQQSRKDALLHLNKKGETRSVIQAGWQAFQCGMGTIARNWGETGKQIALAHVKATYTIYGKQMSCPKEVQDSATRQLTYSLEDYRADFAHLVALPSNIIRSRPVAKPVEVTHNGNDLVIELRDEAGYTRDTLFISGDINPAFAQAQAAGTNQSQLQVVNNGTAGPNSTVRVSGRSMVNGIGSTRGNAERSMVRELASKASEGDLESARTLAGSVKNRTGELKRNVAKASTDKALIRENKEKRATEARSLVNRATVLESTVETSKAFRKNYDNLYRALGLDDETVADSGRVVERPGSTGNTNGTGSGSTVVSTLPNAADKAAADAYKQEQLRKGITVIKDTIEKMTAGVVSLSAQLNKIITRKEELTMKLPEMAGKTTFDKIRLGDFDNRGDRIYNGQQPLVRARQEITSLNAQEMGLKAAISLAKNSVISYIKGAQSFQGLMVTSAASRAPASADPMMQQNPMQNPQMNQVPGGSNIPPGMSPPMYNPTPIPQQGMTGIFKLFEIFTLPMAHASGLSFEQKRKHVMKEFLAFMTSYADYSERMESEIVGVRQQAWERFIINEREMRAEPLLSAEARVIMYSYADSLSEEVPELIKVKNSGKLSSGTDRQLFQYIEQIRSDSAQLNDLLRQESELISEVQSNNPLNDDISWTGMLPAIALQ